VQKALELGLDAEYKAKAEALLDKLTP